MKIKFSLIFTKKKRVTKKYYPGNLKKSLRVISRSFFRAASRKFAIKREACFFKVSRVAKCSNFFNILYIESPSIMNLKIKNNDSH